MAFTSNFQAAFIILKHPCINVSTTFTGTNVLLEKRWTSQAPTKMLEMRFLFAKPSFAYFQFLWGEKMAIGSCMGVVAALRLLKPLSNSHKIGQR
jgi:hypothetical protein